MNSSIWGFSPFSMDLGILICLFIYKQCEQTFLPLLLSPTPPLTCGPAFRVFFNLQSDLWPSRRTLARQAAPWLRRARPWRAGCRASRTRSRLHPRLELR
jgi:hypothetical protein